MSAFMLRGGGDYSLRLNGNGKHVGRQSSSPTTPLQKFVETKSRIGQLFNEVEKYVRETSTFLQELASQRDFVPQTVLSEVDQYGESIKTIKDVLARDHMKVVFFGRTSNGKSTVINSMLGSKVLPSGLGHTTRCFVQVEPSPNGDKFILTEESDERKSLDSIDSLTHALCSKEMGEDHLVRVAWPKTGSKLLQNEVVLVDSPGIDVNQKLDQWIDKHCLDADVFVLVSNAESTLTQTEKNFFHRVNDKVSRPNLFILNNRWDASAAEPELTEKVREQHMKQFLKFLVEELGICSPDEAKRRVYFVSAREVLQYRLKNQGILSSPGMRLAEGFQARMLEFEDFERQFELCISQSAIQTKFESHIQKGKHISSCMHEILEKLHSIVAEKRENVMNVHTEEMSILQSSIQKYSEFLRQAKEKITQLSDEVQLKVSSECYEEVLRLENVIDSFQVPFADDIDLYKLELIEHVDRVVTNELQLRCTGGLLERIIASEREMVAEVTGILPTVFAPRTAGFLQFRDPFRFSFAIPYHSLLDDFHENLEFQFSLGVTSLIRRYMALRGGKSRSESEGELFTSSYLIPRPMSASPNSSSMILTSDYNSCETESAVMHSIIYRSAAYVANGGVGLLIVGGLLYRNVDWKIIGGIVGSYCGLYMYERLCWNNRAKERELKLQLRKHLSVRLNQLSHTITMNCENQVTREVSEVLSRLQMIACEAHQEMKCDVDKLSKELSELEKIGKSLSHTKGHATFMCSELDAFLNKYFTQSPTTPQR